MQCIPCPPGSQFLSSPCPLLVKSGVCSQPKWSAGHNLPMTNCSICSDTGEVFQILLVIVSNILRCLFWFWFGVFWVFFLVVCFGFICLVGFGFFFSTGFPQLCLTLTSASGNQGSFHSPSASKSTLIFFFFSSSTTLVYSTRKSRSSNVQALCHT